LVDVTVNYRSVTIKIELKDWCSRTELRVYIETVVSSLFLMLNPNTVLAPHTVNAISRMKF